MGLKLSRKEVSSEEFYDAYHGGASHESKVAASNNRGILRGVTSRFAKCGKLDEDECSSCEMIALWRCLQYHQDSHGQKFTTSLYRFCFWECCKELAKKRRKAESRMGRDVLPAIARHAVDEHDSWSSSPVNQEPDEIEQVDQFDEIIDNIDRLPYAWQKTIIKQYYLSGLTHEQIGFRNGGFSKETARLKLDQAFAELKLLFTVQSA